MGYISFINVSDFFQNNGDFSLVRSQSSLVTKHHVLITWTHGGFAQRVCWSSSSVTKSLTAFTGPASEEDSTSEGQRCDHTDSFCCSSAVVEEACAASNVCFFLDSEMGHISQLSLAAPLHWLLCLEAVSDG